MYNPKIKSLFYFSFLNGFNRLLTIIHNYIKHATENERTGEQRDRLCLWWL